MKNWGGQFTPKLGGHFELESGAHFKLELGGQYHWNLQVGVLKTFSIANFLSCSGTVLYIFVKSYILVNIVKFSLHIRLMIKIKF